MTSCHAHVSRYDANDQGHFAAHCQASSAGAAGVLLQGMCAGKDGGMGFESLRCKRVQGFVERQ